MVRLILAAAAAFSVTTCNMPVLAEELEQPGMGMSTTRDLCDWPDPGFTIAEDVEALVTKSDYNRMLDQVDAAYQPVFKKLGYKFKIHRSWADGTVNAQAWWSGNSIAGWTCNIEMFGGLARFPKVTPTGVRQVALHEIGHCIGGPPYYTGESMSVEGQADFYSTSVGCRILKVGCRASSLNVAQSLARMSGETVPHRPVPPLPPVSRTQEDHPDAPCRLVTFDAGIDGKPRPRCWFKP